MTFGFVSSLVFHKAVMMGLPGPNLEALGVDFGVVLGITLGAAWIVELEPSVSAAFLLGLLIP